MVDDENIQLKDNTQLQMSKCKHWQNQEKKCLLLWGRAETAENLLRQFEEHN